MHGAFGGRPIKTGKYSKHLGKLARGYEESLADAELMNMRQPIAVLDAAFKRLQERVNEFDTPECRKKAWEALRHAEDAGRAGDTAGAQAAMAELRRLLKDGVAEDRNLKIMVETGNALILRMKDGWDIRLKKSQVMGAKELVAVMAQFVEIIRRVADQPTAMRIIKEIDSRLLTAPREVEILNIQDAEKKPDEITAPPPKPDRYRRSGEVEKG